MKAWGESSVESKRNKDIQGNEWKIQFQSIE